MEYKKSIIVRAIPESKHRTFKTRCTEHGVSMTEALTMFIDRVEMSSGSIIDQWKAEDARLPLEDGK